MEKILTGVQSTGTPHLETSGAISRNSIIKQTRK
jgi:hypothetical protein